VLYLLSDQVYPLIEIVFGGNDQFRSPQVLDVEPYIGVKSFKARGKRVTTFEVGRINELEPVRFPEEDGGESESPGSDAVDGEDREEEAQRDLFK
jgi:topoisomerase-4 subunit A